MTTFTVNGREYHPADRPIVGICLDGSADEYISCAFDRDRMPRTKQMTVAGYRGLVRGALPSFTNVNNAAIATGVPASENGISGNFFLNPETGEAVMMNSGDFLRCPTIFASAADAGRRVAVITAKEKLRDILAKGLDGIAISSEKANTATDATHGISNVEGLVGEPTPPIYSADASLFVLRAGVALIEREMADFLYLSLTDYMQHKFAPATAESLDFYAAIDHEIGRLLDTGAIVVATADHGMNAKVDDTGAPNVIFLQTELDQRFGPGHRVILPITDPYVVHHGALGSFATIHLAASHTADEVAAWLAKLPGVTEVYQREQAADHLQLPPDRVGDLVVLSARDVVLGRTLEHHDLSAVATGLRSHGGRYEEMVPLLVSHPLTPEYTAYAAADPRNFDLFDFACNGVQS